MPIVTTDLNGDGQSETIYWFASDPFSRPGGTVVLTGIPEPNLAVYRDNAPPPLYLAPGFLLNRPILIDEWQLSEYDSVAPARLKGGTANQLVVTNNSDGWTGVVEWNEGDHSFHLLWGVPSTIQGPAGSWNRASDTLVPVDVDGDGADEIFVYNNSNLYNGVWKWMDNSLQVIWQSPSPIPGQGGHWVRNPDDYFYVDAHVPNDVLVRNPNRWGGAARWLPLNDGTGRMGLLMTQILAPPPPPPPRPDPGAAAEPGTAGGGLGGEPTKGPRLPGGGPGAGGGGGGIIDPEDPAVHELPDRGGPRWRIGRSGQTGPEPGDPVG
jgi:hypothetical protein